MKNKHLVILGIAALIMVVLTVIVSTESTRKTDTFAKGSYLVQGLNPGKVNRIYMERYGDSVELKRSGSGFLIANKGGYPAKSDRVNAIFYAVTEIRCGSKITSNKDNYPTLGVDGGEESTFIRFFGEDGKKIVGIIIGKIKENDKGLRFYVRLEGGEDVYLTEKYITFLNTDYGGYISERILPGEKESYNRMTVRNRRGSYEFVKKNGAFALKGVSGADKLDQKKIDDLVQKAVGLRIFDIFAGDTAPTGLAFDMEMRLYKDDKTWYRVRLGEKEGKCYAAVEAHTDFDAEKITITKDESEESLKEKESLLVARDAVEGFNSLNRAWIYEVGDRNLKFLENTP
ncbi:MAG: DUF4340 domain-containing protein, partial [Deltaproteobacteria bacterium]|nr:DUF4340 domain-containing protein [Deltaproteobacteria bacterium]